MSNRSHEENESIILTALRQAGEAGLSLDEVRLALFGEGEKSNSLTKKLLERMRSKGCMRVVMFRNGPRYVIIPGH